MLRAVPSIIRIAASTDEALRSTIFVSAILRTSSFEMVATLSLLGTEDALSRLHAFLIRTAAGVFCYEAKGAVCIDCDNHRNYEPDIIFCALVKLFCKSNNVDTVLSKCRTNRWCGCCLARRNLSLIYPISFRAMKHGTSSIKCGGACGAVLRLHALRKILLPRENIRRTTCSQNIKN